MGTEIKKKTVWREGTEDRRMQGREGETQTEAGETEKGGKECQTLCLCCLLLSVF